MERSGSYKIDITGSMKQHDVVQLTGSMKQYGVVQLTGSMKQHDVVQLLHLEFSDNLHLAWGRLKGVHKSAVVFSEIGNTT